MLVLVMRLFVALDLTAEIRECIHRFIEQMRPLAPPVRWVGAESLHVTLKFIGEVPDTKVEAAESTLAQVSGANFSVSFRGCGFFPTAKSARVFWVGIEAGPELAKLAADIETALEPLGIAREKRGFNPHLTLARFIGGSGTAARRRDDKQNRDFVRVQEHLTKIAPPRFGLMTTREFFLYRSQLSSQGSRYSKLVRFPLGENKG